MATIVDAITEVFKFLNNIGFSTKKQIRKVINVYDAIHYILRSTNVKRCLVFKMHNGGGIIKPTGQLFISVMYEDYSSPFTSVKADYQNLPLDGTTIKVFMEVMENKRVEYKTDTLIEGTMKQIYEKDGVQQSRIYYIGKDRKNVYFCSCVTSDPFFENTITIDLNINKIKQNIK